MVIGGGSCTAPWWQGLAYVAQVDSDFFALEDELLGAMRDQDLGALDRLLSDDFIITTAGWLREPAGKQAWVGALSSHSLDGFELHTVDVRAYDCVVVALVHSTQSGTFRDAAYTHELRYTDVWKQSDSGAWQLDVRHATLLPDPA
jgi:ketosteroid isomerase-like protein